MKMFIDNYFLEIPQKSVLGFYDVTNFFSFNSCIWDENNFVAS